MERSTGQAKDTHAAPPARRWTGSILTVAYMPPLAWSVVASAWALAHLPFTRVFLLIFIGFIVLPFAFRRRPGVVTFMVGVAGAHFLGAFALHSLLRLPFWTAGAFFFGSIALLIAHGVRAMNAWR